MAIALDGLVAGVRESFGPDLIGVVLYGSAVAPDQQAAGAEHDVLVLVRAVSMPALRATSGVVRKWIGAGNPPPLLLTLAEWQSSADVFAIEYADLLERHRVVSGTFPTEGVHVRRADIRQQLETESMGKLLRLRRGLMAAGDDAKQQHALLDDALPTMLALFRATVRLHGEAIPPSSEALCDRAAALAGFSAKGFHAVLAHRRAKQRLSGDALAHSLGAYHEALEKLVAHVDRLQVTG